MEILDFIIFTSVIFVSLFLAFKFIAYVYTSLTILSPRLINGNINFLDNKKPFIPDKITAKTDIFISLSKSEKQELNDIKNNIISFKVFCASERSLSKMFNLIPWESRGILKFDGSDVHFTGMRYRPRLFYLSKTAIRVKYKFPRNQVKISFLPAKMFKDGGLSWLKMEVHNRSFYFTSGHQSRLAKSNKVSTQDIYEIVTDI